MASNWERTSLRLWGKMGEAAFGRGSRFWKAVGLWSGLLGLAIGCSESDQPEPSPGSPALVPIRLQTDWYAQAEHGGFYQALAKGFYEEAGLEVEILQGGINFMGALKVTRGEVDFAVHRADAIITHVAEGMQLRMVAAIFQHDAQGLLLHAANPVRSLAELDGHKVIAMPGAHWIRFINRKYDLSLTIVPHDKGLERFMGNPAAIQQCMVTSEPFFMKQAGIEVRTLLLAESGFDPCHALYAHQQTLRERPEVVRAFVGATLSGWEDYLENDPTPAHQLILARNPRQSLELLEFSREALRSGGFIRGRETPLPSLGSLNPQRLEELVQTLLELDLIKQRLPVEAFADISFAP